MAVTSIELTEALPIAGTKNWNYRFLVGYSKQPNDPPFFAKITVQVAGADDITGSQMKDAALSELHLALRSMRETSITDLQALLEKGPCQPQ